MTRRKWTRLRRQRPELFQCLPAYEAWTKKDRQIMAPVSKRQAIATVTAYRLGGDVWWERALVKRKPVLAGFDLSKEHGPVLV